MKRKILILSMLFLFIFSSAVYAFDISSTGSDFSTSSSFFDLDYTLLWAYELIADFFGIPYEDMRLRGGYFFALVLAPILLVYMIFYGILDRLNLFDDPRIQRGIPIILALMLAPLGGYRHFFYGVTSFMTFGTASLLYIFLFVALLGYGYKNMYARGRSDFSKSSQMMQHAKNKSGQIKDVESRLKKLYRELADVDSQLHKYQFEMTELKTGNKKVPEGLIKTIKHIEKKHEHINNQISRLNNYQDELSKNMEIIIHGD